MKNITLRITGMNCASCSTLLEKNLHDDTRILSASVNIATEKANIRFRPEDISETEIGDIIRHSGFGVAEKHQEKENFREVKIQKLRKQFLLSLLFGIPLFFLSMGEAIGLPSLPVSQLTNVTLQFLLTTVIMVVTAPLYISGFVKLIQRNPNMDSLVEIGTLAAYFYSLTLFFLLIFAPENMGNEYTYFESAGFILIFISLGKYLEEKTKGKTSEAIEKLMGLQPKTAVVFRNNSEVSVPISDVQKNDIVLIKPGEKIPVDGIISEGASTIDESAITGESIPVQKKQGDTVIGATINKTGAFRFIATGVGEETMLAQIVKIMEEAVSSKAPIQLLADKVSFYFVPTVMGIATLTCFAWIMAGFSFSFALTAFVSVLIIACPCSLGLATPTAIMMGTGLSAKRGILIKNSKALEMAHKVDTIVFDKTGTLTKGTPEVVSFHSFDNKEKEGKQTAFSLAKNSNHPLSLAVSEWGKKNKIQEEELSHFQEKEGKGLSAETKEKTPILLGNRTLLEEEGVSLSPNEESLFLAEAQEGKTPLFVARGKKIIGILGVMDDIKETTPLALQKLQESGKHVLMITGDHKVVAQAIAKKLGIQEVLSEVLPGKKAEKIQMLQQQGRTVAMVGDGINDAPALAQADLGIALGAGTDIALEAGDIILVRNNLEDVSRAIEISKYTLQKIQQNLFWAFFYNIIGIPIAAGALYPFFGFLLNPMVAAFAMSFSSVSVVGNSLLMKWRKFQ
ncbi:heavy metal translocating P-type ATPase [Candidatus Peregrinibacteria bacterium]|nr:MAG: heavy metal translocating P-type ATPase [Candidatus Peregrinibacteria bacterium]